MKFSSMSVPSAVMMERNSSLAKHLIEALLLGVERLSAQRQNRLEPPVAPLLGAAARAVALHDEQFVLLRLCAPCSWSSLPTSGAASSSLLCRAPRRGPCGAASRARAACDRLFDDLLGQLLMLEVLEIAPSAAGSGPPPLAVRASVLPSLRLGLALKLRVCQHRRASTAVMPSRKSSPVRFVVLVLERAQPSRDSRSSPWCSAALKPVSCVPPSAVGMLLTKE